MFRDKSDRVIYNIDTGKIKASLTPLQNLEAMMSNWPDEKLDWINIPEEKFNVKDQLMPTYINLETKEIIR